MNFNATSDRLELRTSFGAFGSPATYLMTFDAGSGPISLSNVQINGEGGLAAGNTVGYRTISGGVFGAGQGAGTLHSGPITGIVFTVYNTSGIRLNSITGTPTCFGKGTRTATPDGACAVEFLNIGDTILTHDGDTRQVLWIGRQSFATRTGVPEHLRPVRISAGALGDGLPQRDLVLTADHALLLDGLLINASALVNGTTITFDTPANIGGRMTVYHIETEDHAVILAEGCAAETYVDVAERARFDNYDDYVALYGTDRIILENPLPRNRHLPPAAPRPAGPSGHRNPRSGGLIILWHQKRSDPAGFDQPRDETFPMRIILRRANLVKGRIIKKISRRSSAHRRPHVSTAAHIIKAKVCNILGRQKEAGYVRLC